MRRNANNVNAKDPVQFWLMVGAACVALAGAVLTLPARTVQADALLSRPEAAAPSVAPVTSATPVVVSAPKVEHKAPVKLLHGFASWYGGVFNGRQTASGEVYNMNELTACHPTLPFGTKVRVVNTRNHRAVVVRITDRGDPLWTAGDPSIRTPPPNRLAWRRWGLCRSRFRCCPRRSG